MMNPYITFLLGYLKDVDSKIIPITISSEDLNTLRAIYGEVKLWQKEYNSAVQEYKTYQQIYELR